MAFTKKVLQICAGASFVAIGAISITVVPSNNADAGVRDSLTVLAAPGQKSCIRKGLLVLPPKPRVQTKLKSNKRLSGQEFFADKTKKLARIRGGAKNNILKLRNLSEGRYRLGVRLWDKDNAQHFLRSYKKDAIKHATYVKDKYRIKIVSRRDFRVICGI